MGDSKKWWQSRSIWNGIVITLIGVYELVNGNLGPALGFDLPEIPAWIYTILGAVGIISRKVATKKID